MYKEDLRGESFTRRTLGEIKIPGGLEGRNDYQKDLRGEKCTRRTG